MTFILFYVNKEWLLAVYKVLMIHDLFAVSYIENFHSCRALDNEIIVKVIEKCMQRQLIGLFI